VTLEPGKVSSRVFSKILEFLYTGLATIEGKDDPDISNISSIANLLELESLTNICTNVLEGNEDLNPSIGTYLNDQTAEKLLDLFFNKKLFADIVLIAEEKKFFAHKAMLAARCDVMNRMLNGNFSESSKTEVDITDVPSADAFAAFLQFIYTAHAPIEGNNDMVGIMLLADRFGISRLVTLCELYISKAVEKATTDGIEKADIDVIGLLLTAQQCNAKQLADFCLHFVSQNYQPMSKRCEFKKLKGENLKYVEKNQWPPVEYLKKLEEYNKSVGGTADDKNCVCL